MNIIIWGGKSAALWSDISFYGARQRSRKSVICERKTDDLPPQMAILNAVIPIQMHLFMCLLKKNALFVQSAKSVACVKQNASQ